MGKHRVYQLRRHVRVRYGARVMRAIPVMLALLFAARSAIAEPEDGALEPGTMRTEYEHIWYGDSIALFYGIGYAAGAGGIVLSNQTSPVARTAGFVITGSAGLTMLLAPATTHFNYDNAAGGFATLGGQLGSAAVGGLVGAAVADDTGDGIFYGAVAGHFLWAIVDVTLIARQDRLVAAETVAVAPWAAPVSGGGLVGGLSVEY